MTTVLAQAVQTAAQASVILALVAGLLAVFLTTHCALPIPSAVQPSATVLSMHVPPLEL